MMSRGRADEGRIDDVGATTTFAMPTADVAVFLP